MPFENHPGIMPTQQLWHYRRELFSYYMGIAIGDEYIGTSTDQTRILELELERVFCSGAWIGAIILACACSEVYIHSQGTTREAKFLSKYKLREDWMWLERRRNQLIHMNNNISYQDYMHAPEAFEEEAQRAVQIALKIILLGTREELESSIKKETT